MQLLGSRVWSKFKTLPCPLGNISSFASLYKLSSPPCQLLAAFFASSWLVQHLVDGLFGRKCKCGQGGLELLSEAFLGFLGAVRAVETTVLCLCMIVPVAVANNVVAVDEVSLELGEGGAGRLSM